MKQQRQQTILAIIAEQEIETQAQLLEALRVRGFGGTQATISRDIKELRIVKELTTGGTYRYSAPRPGEVGAFSARLNAIFRECVTSCDAAQNMVVLKTMPGLASAACSAVDTMNMPAVVGTLAGDDTGLIVMRDSAAAAAFTAELTKLIGS